MRMSGQAAVPASRQVVWEALQDAAVLGRTLPGCQALEATGPGRYEATLTATVASLAGTYRGTIEVVDAVAPETYHLAIHGAGEHGTVRADAIVRLEDEVEGTVVHYTADAIVDGMIGDVGQRVLAGVAQRTVDGFFEALEQDLTPRAATSPPAEDTPPAAPAVTQPAEPAAAPRPSEARGRRPVELGLAALIGGVVAAIGVVLGRRRSG